MKNKLYQKIVEDYIDAYNSLNIKKMISGMHDEIRFENISNGEINLTTNGIDELKNHAEQATQCFTKREQKITDINFKDNRVEISIDYHAILAIDLPTGQKAGDKIELKGRSIFKFKDGKIIELRDICP